MLGRDFIHVELIAASVAAKGSDLAIDPIPAQMQASYELVRTREFLHRLCFLASSTAPQCYWLVIIQLCPFSVVASEALVYRPLCPGVTFTIVLGERNRS